VRHAGKVAGAAGPCDVRRRRPGGRCPCRPPRRAGNVRRVTPPAPSPR
jgi:hypothetical protein